MTGRITEVADAGRGISLAYEQFGDPGADPLVLIMGLGQQMNGWPTAFCGQLAARDYQVVRFDNRDTGQSAHMRFRPPSVAALLARRWPAEQYDLTDMAADTVGLLDALGCHDAHLVGASMGGMIAQTVAALWPERVRTLTSIMSTTGARRVGRPALSTWRLMAARPPKTREAAGGAATARAITGARLETIAGLGHDLPAGAWPRLIDLIDRHARQGWLTDHARRGGRSEPTGSSDAVTSF